MARFVGILVKPVDVDPPSDRRARTFHHNVFWNGVKWGMKHMMAGAPIPTTSKLVSSTMVRQHFRNNWLLSCHESIQQAGYDNHDPSVIYVVGVLGFAKIPGTTSDWGWGAGYLELRPELGSHIAWSGLATIAADVSLPGWITRYLIRHEIGHGLVLPHSSGWHFMNSIRWMWAMGLRQQDREKARRFLTVSVNVRNSAG